MIWQDTAHTGTARDKIAGQLLEDVPSLCGNKTLSANSSLHQAVQGVALYLDQVEVIPEEIDPRQSRELLAHALETAGESGLARRIRLFGNRIIYPATWIACGGETVWVLDTRQLLAPRDAGMELIFFERMRIVLSTFADVWDAASGKGFLGLKGLPAATGTLLGPASAVSASRRLMAETRHLCATHLIRFQSQRGWRTSPAILTLLS